MFDIDLTLLVLKHGDNCDILALCFDFQDNEQPFDHLLLQMAPWQLPFLGKKEEKVRRS